MTFKSMRASSWPFFIGGGADNIVSNVEVDGGGIVTSRMFNLGAISYSTFTGLNVHDASTSSIDNNVSIQYYAQYLTFINSQSTVGGTTAGWMGFGNDNTFNTWINSGASGNTGWAMSVGRAPSDDTNWTIDGGTWSGLASPGNDVFNFINSNHFIENATISGPGGWGINFNTVTNSCINGNTFAGSSGLASGGIYKSTSSVTGSGNTMNGNSSNLTAGTCGLSVSPATLAFGNQNIGTTSFPLTATLTNNTTSPITVASAYALGDYSISANSCGVLSFGGGSCAISVTFTPQASGASNSYALAYPASTGGTTIIPLTGAGAQPSGGSGLSLFGSVTVFGNVQLVTVASGGSGGPLTYAARTDNCVHGYSTNAITVAPFYNPANETCVAGKTTGESGSGLIFQAGASDPLPFNRLDAGTNPAVANTSYTDPDFGSYAIFVTDPSTNGLYGTSWNLGSGGGYDAFGTGQSDGSDTLLTFQNGGTVPYFVHVIASRFLGHTCSVANPCVVVSNIHGASCDPGSTCTNTQITSSGSDTFSRNPSNSPNTLMEFYKGKMYKDTWTSSLAVGIPNGTSDSVTRTLLVDLTSDNPAAPSPAPFCLLATTCDGPASSISRTTIRLPWRWLVVDLGSRVRLMGLTASFSR